MLKQTVLINTLTTFIVLVINFGFKIYLASEFSKQDLVIYYTITDIFSIISRVFAGCKDSLITIYNQTSHKFRLLKTFTAFLIIVNLIVAIVIIPLVFNLYLVHKINDLDINWFYICVMFILINFISYYLYTFLVTKHYNILSINDILRALFLIVAILSLYVLLGFDANYKTLIYGAIIGDIFVLLYLVYMQHKMLPRFNFLKLVGLTFAKFKDNTNYQFIKLTILASSSYFTYGLLLFAPTWVMLNDNVINELADFQVVARSIFFALISVFSFPLGRFMFPEFSSLIAKKDYISLANIKYKFITLLILFGVLVISGCWLLSEWVIGYIFPIEYSNSYKMINILIVALPFIMYQNLSESVIKAIGNYKLNFFIKLMGIIAFILSYIIFDYLNTEFSSIYAFVCGFVCIFFMSLYFELRIKKTWAI